jgi:hypothetical protein
MPKHLSRSALRLKRRLHGLPETLIYGSMNITLFLDDDLVRKVRRIAVERDTTLTGMVRDYLEGLAAEDASSAPRRRERETVERSFEQFRFRIGKQTRKRADLYAQT